MWLVLIVLVDIFFLFVAVAMGGPIGFIIWLIATIYVTASQSHWMSGKMAEDMEKTLDKRNDTKTFLHTQPAQDEIKDNYLSLGNFYASRGKYEQAIKEYQKMISLNPNHALAYYNCGIAYNQIGHHGEAIECYKKVIMFNPSHAECYNNLALSYDKLHQHNKAIDYYTKAIEIDANEPVPYENIGICYYKLSRYDEAKKSIQKAKELYNMKGDYQKNQDMDILLTDISCRESKEVRPSDFNSMQNGKNEEYYINQGNIYLDAGQYKKAIDEYKKVINVNPSFTPAYFNLGIAYTTLGEEDNALEAYQKAIELDPNYVEAYGNIGWIYRSQNNYEKSIEYYNKARNISPNDPLIYENLGLGYYFLGDSSTGEKNLRHAQKLYSEKQNYRKAKDMEKFILTYKEDFEKERVCQCNGCIYMRSGQCYLGKNIKNVEPCRYKLKETDIPEDKCITDYIPDYYNKGQSEYRDSPGF
ncbi:MAG: tetratricopeptide repeat protein [Candidatus Omnitrophica bacterium]|nr:tetratricopeptide repeat protein [Candidatus Omnitrophota bacterium]